MGISGFNLQKKGCVIGRIFTLGNSISRLLLCFIISTLLVGCITIEVPSDTESNSEPNTPTSIEKMEKLGYNFNYHAGDDPYWEAENSIDGWTFRIWESGAFGMSGQFDKNFDAQTEASIDFFESLDVSPEQASFTNQLIVRAMANANGEASACDKGLCCIGQVVMSQEIYIWYCEAE
jgi:hypothetical protein